MGKTNEQQFRALAFGVLVALLSIFAARIITRLLDDVSLTPQFTALDTKDAWPVRSSRHHHTPIDGK